MIVSLAPPSSDGSSQAAQYTFTKEHSLDQLRVVGVEGLGFRL